jgi:hypothetical protein
MKRNHQLTGWLNLLVIEHREQSKKSGQDGWTVRHHDEVSALPLVKTRNSSCESSSWLTRDAVAGSE